MERRGVRRLRINSHGTRTGRLRMKGRIETPAVPWETSRPYTAALRWSGARLSVTPTRMGIETFPAPGWRPILQETHGSRWASVLVFLFPLAEGVCATGAGDIRCVGAVSKRVSSQLQVAPWLHVTVCQVLSSPQARRSEGSETAQVPKPIFQEKSCRRIEPRGHG